MFALERCLRAAAAASALAWILIAAPRASAQELVNFGDSIDEPGVYFLNGNQSGNGTGVFIRSDDVALFMFRFTLRYVPPPPPLNGDALVPPPAGISIIGHDRVAVFGGRVNHFPVGIFMLNCEDCTMRDTRIDESNLEGISGFQVDSSSFVRVRTDHNGRSGIAISNGSHDRFYSVLSDNNGVDGIMLRSELFVAAGPVGSFVTDNTVRKCWLSYNHKHGLELIDADDNTVKQTQCVANEYVGILLDKTPSAPAFGNDAPPSSLEGSDGNRVAKNWCPANGIGIGVGDGSEDNELTQNIALASFQFDAFDGNDAPPCANTWFLNTLIFRGGDGALCIF